MRHSELQAVFYTSESCIEGGEDSSELRKLIEAAQQKNERLAITGALILAGNRFAQYIEGPAAAVQSLIASIAADDRHKQMAIAFDQSVPGRRFGRWSLAYAGASLYMWKHLEAVITSEGVERQDRLNSAMRLITGLAAPSATDLVL